MDQMDVVERNRLASIGTVAANWRAIARQLTSVTEADVVAQLPRGSTELEHSAKFFEMLSERQASHEEVWAAMTAAGFQAHIPSADIAFRRHSKFRLDPNFESAKEGLDSGDLIAKLPGLVPTHHVVDGSNVSKDSPSRVVRGVDSTTSGPRSGSSDLPAVLKEANCVVLLSAIPLTEFDHPDLAVFRRFPYSPIQSPAPVLAATEFNTCLLAWDISEFHRAWDTGTGAQDIVPLDIVADLRSRWTAARIPVLYVGPSTVGSVSGDRAVVVLPDVVKDDTVRITCDLHGVVEPLLFKAAYAFANGRDRHHEFRHTSGMVSVTIGPSDLSDPDAVAFCTRSTSQLLHALQDYQFRCLALLRPELDPPTNRRAFLLNLSGVLQLFHKHIESPQSVRSRMLFPTKSATPQTVALRMPGIAATLQQDLGVRTDAVNFCCLELYCNGPLASYWWLKLQLESGEPIDFDGFRLGSIELVLDDSAGFQRAFKLSDEHLSGTNAEQFEKDLTVHLQQCQASDSIAHDLAELRPSDALPSPPVTGLGVSVDFAEDSMSTTNAEPAFSPAGELLLDDQAQFEPEELISFDLATHLRSSARLLSSSSLASAPVSPSAEADSAAWTPAASSVQLDGLPEPPRVPDVYDASEHTKRRRVEDPAGLQELQHDKPAGDAELAPSGLLVLPPTEDAVVVEPSAVGALSDASRASSSGHSNPVAPLGSEPLRTDSADQPALATPKADSAAVAMPQAGAVIVQFMLLPPTKGSLDHPSATELAEALVRLVDLRSEFLRPIGSNMRIAVSYKPFPADLFQLDCPELFRPAFNSSRVPPPFADAPPADGNVFVAIRLDPARQGSASDLLPRLGSILELTEPSRIAGVSVRADENSTRRSLDDGSSLSEPELLGDITIIPDRNFLLGEGRNGQVYLGWHSPPGAKPRMLALKKARADDLEADLAKERVLMRKLCWERAQAHPPSHGSDRVLPYFGLAQFHKPATVSIDVFVCTQWMPGGCFAHRLTLSGRTYPFNLARILAVVLDVAVGMEYVHANRIVHNDLHGYSVLLNPIQGRYEAKVAGFGRAIEMPDWPCDEQSRDFSSFGRLLQFAFTVDSRHPIEACRAEGVRELIEELGVRDHGLPFEAIVARLQQVKLPADDVVLN
eukprot:TRINITY_DN3251_c0_g1_i1.p1 TRINITY_DN3251_c0_g1~~TRINITY_DN3251_c0_g1_i1.p1  ORF type:complete len:1144 (+),score=164.16 TRINITY_DN3251_c0_g1_i1:222-3653(+)